MTPLDAAPSTDDPRAARAEAARLLDELIRERAAAEARLAAIGREDPLKQVTGRSAFDRAIRSTQDVLARMDAMLLENAAGGRTESH